MIFHFGFLAFYLFHAFSFGRNSAYAKPSALSINCISYQVGLHMIVVMIILGIFSKVRCIIQINIKIFCGRQGGLVTIV